MPSARTYRPFTCKEAVFTICCESFETVCREIVHQRKILDDYITRQPRFHRSLVPVAPWDDAPDSAIRMARAAHLAGVGPMAAVAGTMAQLAAEAAMKEGDSEVIVENGGDIYLKAVHPVLMALNAGAGKLASQLAFDIDPDNTPLAICSSSGNMGHSMSLGECDLATVVSRDSALADASATAAANLVRSVGDVDKALEEIGGIEGVLGVLIVKDDRIGLIGQLPPLVKCPS